MGSQLLSVHIVGIVNAAVECVIRCPMPQIRTGTNEYLRQIGLAIPNRFGTAGLLCRFKIVVKNIRRQNRSQTPTPTAATDTFAKFKVCLRSPTVERRCVENAAISRPV